MLGKGQAGEFRVHQLIVDLHLECPAPTLVAGDLYVRCRVQQELSQQLALHRKVAGAAVGGDRQTDTVARRGSLGQLQRVNLPVFNVHIDHCIKTNKQQQWYSTGIYKI